MSAISSQAIPSLRHGRASRPVDYPPVKSAAPHSFDAAWQNFVACLALATTVAIVAYLISLS
jgi:hypothetical protein